MCVCVCVCVYETEGGGYEEIRAQADCSREATEGRECACVSAHGCTWVCPIEQVCGCSDRVLALLSR